MSQPRRRNDTPESLEALIKASEQQRRETADLALQRALDRVIGAYKDVKRGMTK